MKTLFFATLLFFSTQSEAAQFTELESPVDLKLQKLWKVMSEHSIPSNGYEYSEHRSYNVKMSPGQDLVSTITQSIYARRAEEGLYSYPTAVSVEYLPQGREGLAEVMFTEMTRLKFDPKNEAMSEQMTAIHEFLNTYLTPKDFAIFKTFDNNSFGACQSITFFNRRSYELTVMGVCETE